MASYAGHRSKAQEIGGAENPRNAAGPGKQTLVDTAVHASKPPAPTPGKRSLTENLPSRGPLESGVGGSELPYRVDLERAFGEDLSTVTANVGQSQLLAPMGARGAAIGERLAFADATPSRDLVAHEVTHALQNRHAGAAGGLGLKTFSAGRDDASEREADDLGARAAAGERVTVTGAPSASIQLVRHDDVPRKHVRLTANQEEGTILGVLQDSNMDDFIEYQFQPLNGGQPRAVFGAAIEDNDTWKQASADPYHTTASQAATPTRYQQSGPQGAPLTVNHQVDILGGAGQRVKVQQPHTEGWVPTAAIARTDTHADRRTPLYDPVAGPTVDDVAQGSLNDCYLLAPLLSVVRTHPDRIMNMLLDSGTKVTVVFHERVSNTQPVQFQPHPVTVEKSLVERANGTPRFSHGPHDWPAIVEKAWAAFKLGGYYTMIPQNRSADIALEALTGQIATSESMNTVTAQNPLDSQDSLTAYLHLHLNGNAPQLITMGTDDNLNNPPQGIVAKHWYEVVSIAQDNTIRVRNPHGPTQANGNQAEVDLTPGQVIACFTSFSRVPQ